jgi:hypothetical protein
MSTRSGSAGRAAWLRPDSRPRLSFCCPVKYRPEMAIFRRVRFVAKDQLGFAPHYYIS